jgi:GMP synthase-like glutamine amidotransferase
MTRTLLLDNTLHPHLFGLARRWAHHLRGVPTDIVHAPSSRRLPDVRDYTHLVLTGSEASIQRWTPWMEREAECVRRAAGAGLRVLGSCFGHEMLVAALSGRDCVRRAEVPEIGWTSLEIVARDELLSGVPNPWIVFSFHLAEVATPIQAPWRVLARSARCETQILRFGDAPVWGIQGHPEISRRAAELATRAYLLLARRRGGVPRTSLRGMPADDQVFRDVTERFLAVAERRSG